MFILIALTDFVCIIYLFVLFTGKLPAVNKYFLYSAIVILPAAVYIVLNAGVTQKYFAEINAWPRTEAQIIEKKISGNRAVLPEVVYKYIVADSTYLGKSNLGIPAFGGRNKRILTARIALNDLPIGAKLIVAYNSVNPHVSTTQFHPPWSHYGKLGFGGFLYAFSLLIILFKIPLNRKIKSGHRLTPI